MDLSHLDLPLIWAALIAFAVLAYVVLDGFDLGVGILFAAEHGDDERDVMVNSIAPVWDGNETWLVLGGGGLFAVSRSPTPPAVAHRSLIGRPSVGPMAAHPSRGRTARQDKGSGE